MSVSPILAIVSLVILFVGLGLFKA